MKPRLFVQSLNSLGQLYAIALINQARFYTCPSSISWPACQYMNSTGLLLNHFAVVHFHFADGQDPP